MGQCPHASASAPGGAALLCETLQPNTADRVPSSEERHWPGPPPGPSHPAQSPPSPPPTSKRFSAPLSSSSMTPRCHPVPVSVTWTALAASGIRGPAASELSELPSSVHAAGGFSRARPGCGPPPSSVAPRDQGRDVQAL
ncbi:hypothetical protein HJG60_007737 [Phyllostomus discolor]|uniref:Uncharacterized protein n=1 Tax=Phyllostomus discolor TaxID=89673 RepID=A0A834EVI4_9CHIR|nr:hypothetical protein HJG60_007737 [Phyllostomus discolor]